MNTTSSQAIFDSLTEKMEQLVEKEEKVKRSLGQDDAKDLLDKLHRLREHAAKLFPPSERRWLLGCPTPVSLWDHYRFSVRATVLISKADSLLHDLEDVSRRPTTLVSNFIPMNFFGIKDILKDAISVLHNDEVGIVKVLGKPGTGKTSFLKMIHKSVRPGAFDLVILVPLLSSSCDQWHVQKQIMNSMGIINTSDDRTLCSSMLYNTLERRKFLVLIDDLSVPVTLRDIGIPLPDPGTAAPRRKIIFTTASESLDILEVQSTPIELPLLDTENAWKLYRREFADDENLLEPVVKHLATGVAAACGGVALALVAVARATRSIVSMKDWKSAIDHLTAREGNERLLSVLEFCFRRLETDIERECLLYCSLSDGSTRNHLDRWNHMFIAEYLSDDYSASIDDQRKRVLSTLCKLRDARLLDGVKLWEKRIVMHPMVQLMARGHEHGNVCYDECVEMRLLPKGEEEKWEKARRVAIHCNIERLPEEIPDCRAILSLLLNYNKSLSSLPPTYFARMPFLRVLNLSNTNISAISKEINQLAELRYLNLSYTPIVALPEELGDLHKLQQLNLEGTYALNVIPKRAILGLHILKLLNLYKSGFKFSKHADEGGVRVVHLESLKQLEEVGANVRSRSGLNMFLDGKNVLPLVVNLDIEEATGITDEEFAIACQQMVKLRKLRLFKTSELSEFCFKKGQLESLIKLVMIDLPTLNMTRPTQGYVHSNLINLWIDSCGLLRDLKWVYMLPWLMYLRVWNCKAMEELTDAASGIEPLMNLRTLDLRDLPNLRAICTSGTLRLPEVRGLVIKGCPALQKLPLRLQDSPYLREILGETIWWKSLQWENVNAKHSFSAYFNDPWFFGNDDMTTIDSRYRGWDDDELMKI